MSGSDFRRSGAPEPSGHAEGGSAQRPPAPPSSRWRESQPLPQPPESAEPRRAAPGHPPGRSRSWPPEPALDPRRLMPPPRPGRTPDNPSSPDANRSVQPPSPERLRNAPPARPAEPRRPRPEPPPERSQNRVAENAKPEPPRSATSTLPGRPAEREPDTRPEAKRNALPPDVEPASDSAPPPRFIAPPPLERKREGTAAPEPVVKREAAPVSAEPEEDSEPKRTKSASLWERLRERRSDAKRSARGRSKEESGFGATRLIAPAPLDYEPEKAVNSAAETARNVAPSVKVPDQAPARFIAPAPIEKAEEPPPPVVAPPHIQAESESAPARFIAPPPERQQESSLISAPEPMVPQTPPPFESELDPEPPYVAPGASERFSQPSRFAAAAGQWAEPWEDGAESAWDLPREITPTLIDRSPERPRQTEAEAMRAVEPEVIPDQPYAGAPPQIEQEQFEGDPQWSPISGAGPGNTPPRVAPEQTQEAPHGIAPSLADTTAEQFPVLQEVAAPAITSHPVERAPKWPLESAAERVAAASTAVREQKPGVESLTAVDTVPAEPERQSQHSTGAEAKMASAPPAQRPDADWAWPPRTSAPPAGGSSERPLSRTAETRQAPGPPPLRPDLDWDWPRTASAPPAERFPDWPSAPAAETRATAAPPPLTQDLDRNLPRTSSAPAFENTPQRSSRPATETRQPAAPQPARPDADWDWPRTVSAAPASAPAAERSPDWPPVSAADTRQAAPPAFTAEPGLQQQPPSGPPPRLWERPLDPMTQPENSLPAFEAVPANETRRIPSPPAPEGMRGWPAQAESRFASPPVSAERPGVRPPAPAQELRELFPDLGPNPMERPREWAPLPVAAPPSPPRTAASEQGRESSRVAAPPSREAASGFEDEEELAEPEAGKSRKSGLPKLLRRLIPGGRSASDGPHDSAREGRFGLTGSADSDFSTTLSEQDLSSHMVSTMAPTPASKLESVLGADSLDDLRMVQRELRNSVTEQSGILERVQDQVQMLCESADRSAMEQQQLVDELKFFSRWAFIFGMAVALLLVASVAFEVVLLLRQ